MHLELLTILVENRNSILFTKSSKYRCGKLWLDSNSYGRIFNLVKSVKKDERMYILRDICEHYNMVNGDIAVQYTENCTKVLFMYLKDNNEVTISIPSYSIEPTIAVFSKSVSYCDFPLDYWNV